MYKNTNLFEGWSEGKADWGKIHNFIVQRRQFWKDRFNITDGELE